MADQGVFAVRERSDRSAALSDSDWLPQRQPCSQVPTSSLEHPTTIAFGQDAVLVFDEVPPQWLLPAIQQMAAIGNLKENWDSCGGRPIDPRCVAGAAEFLLRTGLPGGPLPSVVPTNRGGVQLEWHCAAVDLEIEFLSASRFRVFFEDLRSGENAEFETIGDFRRVVPYLKRLVEAN